MTSHRLGMVGLDGLTPGRLAQLGQRSVGGFFGGGALQLAAAIGYHALLSLFPLVIFLVWAATWFVDDQRAQTEIVELIADQIALSPAGEADITDALGRAADNATTAGLLAVPLLIWSASAMMTAIRNGVGAAWDVPVQRQFLRGKLLDLGLITLLGLVAVASIGLTLVRRLAPEVAESVWSVAAILLPVTLSFLGFLLIFTLLPPVRTYARDVWPAALLAALLLEGVKIGFAYYLTSISDNNAIYGSLGAIISLMIFIFIAAAVLLFCATVAAELPRVRAGLYDTPSTDGGGGGLKDQIEDEIRRATTGRPEEAFRRNPGEIPPDGDG